MFQEACSLHVFHENLSASNSLQAFQETVNSSILPSILIMWTLSGIDFANSTEDSDSESSKRAQKYDKYFPFILRYSNSLCLVIVLETFSPNTTLLAMKQSGYLYSDHTLFLQISIDNSEQVFIDVQVNHYLIWFPETGTIFQYCVLCFSQKRILVNLADVLNPNYKLTVFSSGKHLIGQWYPIIGDRTKIREGALTESFCVNSNRLQFYSNIITCLSGYIIAMRIAGTLLNVTFTVDILDEYDDPQSSLNIFWLPMFHSDLQFYENSKMKLLEQSQLFIMYCVMTGSTKRRTNNFLTFKLDLCIAFILSLLLYAVLYKKLSKGLDLFWLFIGKPMVQKHRKGFIVMYLPSILILSIVFTASMSIDFLFADLPVSLVDIAKRGFKFQVHRKPILYTVLLSTPKHIVKALSNGFGVKSFVEDVISKDFGFTDRWPVGTMLDEMTRQKLLGVGSKGSMAYTTNAQMSNILSFVPAAVIENKYLCASVLIPDEVYPANKIGYMTWGPMSTKLNEYFTRLFESGIVVRNQVIIMFMRRVKESIRWSELSASLQVPKPLSLESALGLGCKCLVVFGSLVLIANIVYLASCVHFVFCELAKLRVL